MIAIIFFGGAMYEIIEKSSYFQSIILRFFFAPFFFIYFIPVFASLSFLVGILSRSSFFFNGAMMIPVTLYFAIIGAITGGLLEDDFVFKKPKSIALILRIIWFLILIFVYMAGFVLISLEV